MHHMCGTFGPECAKAVVKSPPQHDEIGPQSDGTQDIEATVDTGIKYQRVVGTDSLANFGQGCDGCRCTGELAARMV